MIRERGMRLALTLALVGGLAVPGSEARAGPADASRELTEAEGDLGRAERELSAIDRRLRDAQDRITDADARLAVATGELDRIEGELVRAEHLLDEARRRERSAAAALVRADESLGELLAVWEASQAAIDRRAADAYKYGGTLPTRVLLRSFSVPRDIHDIAVGARTLSRLAATDEAMVAHHLERAKEAAGARAAVAAARSAAVGEQRILDAQRDQVAELVAEQREVLAAIAVDRAHRETVLARLEADEEATAALVVQLGERVRQLRQQLLTAFVTEVTDAAFDGPSPAWAAALPPAGRRWAPAIHGAAGRAGIDGRLLAALVWTESNFIPTAVSRAGALGLCQLLATTAGGLGVDPYDPVQNLLGGARYLRLQLDRFQRVDLALAAYNAGPGRVQRAGGNVPGIVETQLYVVRVLDRWERLADEG